MTPIEQYANRHGIALTVLQMEAIRRWSIGASITYPTQYKSQIMKAKQLYYDFMQDACGMRGETLESKIYKEMEGFHG